MTENELMTRAAQEPDWEEISGELWLQRERVLGFINHRPPGGPQERAYRIAVARLRRRVRRADTHEGERTWGHMDIDPTRVRRRW